MSTYSLRILAVTGILASLTLTAHGQIVGGQIDDFQDGTLANWGGQATRTIEDGGPGGPGDLFLQVMSDPAVNVGHLGTQNNAQWSGNYITAGVVGISLDVRNLGSEEIHLRLLTTGGGGRHANDVTILPVGGDWQHVLIDMSAVGLHYIEGAGSLTASLYGMNRIVFHHDRDPASGHGGAEFITATLGMDNITALANGTPGDADFDGDVDLDDFVRLKQGFAQKPASWFTGDFDRNGAVSLADFAMLKQNFTRGAQVPEPATLSLLGLGLLGVIRRRK